MTTHATAQRYPLAWPTGWTRTPAVQRRHAAFNKRVHAGTYSSGAAYTRKERLTVGDGLERLLGELKRLGARPPGHSVVFKDGNKANCAIENLELLTRADLMRRNTVHHLPTPLVQTIQLLGALTRQIRKRETHGSTTHD